MTDAVMNAIDLRRKLQQHDRLTAPAYIRQWLEQEFWFENLIENGTFDSDTAWTKGTGWTIGAGVANCDGTQTTWSEFNQTVVGINEYTDYFYSVDATRTAGNVYLRLGGASNLVGISASGSYSGNSRKESANDNFIAFADSAFVGTLDNALLYESDGTDIIHRLPAGWEADQVFVDGLLQRSGAAHDFTKETDGFTNWIKPAVAPGALTETCIMGVRKV